jgi:hypothetical protein
MNKYPYNVVFEDKEGKGVTRMVEADNPGQAFHKALKKFKVRRLIKCWLSRHGSAGEFYMEYDPPKNWDMPRPKPKKSSDIQTELALQDKVLRSPEGEAG